MTKKSKVERIRRLWDGKRTTKEIATIVGCMPEYVRVVARQRKFHGVSDIDRRYYRKPGKLEAVRKAKRERFKERYWSDPEFREQQLARRKSRAAA